MITKEPLDYVIGQHIKKIRIRFSHTQERIGEIIGVSPQQIHKYEVGDSKISATRLYKLAQTFNQDLLSFFEAPEKEPDSGFRFKAINQPQQRRIDEINILAKAFVKIKDYKARDSIISLVRSLAGEKPLFEIKKDLSEIELED